MKMAVAAEDRFRLTTSGVAVKKLRCRKRAKIRSRPDALQAICRKRLILSVSQKPSRSYEYRVFQQPQAKQSLNQGQGVLCELVSETCAPSATTRTPLRFSIRVCEKSWLAADRRLTWTRG